MFSMELKFAKCDETLSSQKWVWTKFTNKTMLNNWNNFGRPFEKIGKHYWVD